VNSHARARAKWARRAFKNIHPHVQSLRRQQSSCWSEHKPALNLPDINSAKIDCSSLSSKGALNLLPMHLKPAHANAQTRRQ
jgi:hypothetical protein